MFLRWLDTWRWRITLRGRQTYLGRPHMMETHPSRSTISSTRRTGSTCRIKRTGSKMCKHQVKLVKCGKRASVWISEPGCPERPPSGHPRKCQCDLIMIIIIIMIMIIILSIIMIITIIMTTHNDHNHHNDHDLYNDDDHHLVHHDDHHHNHDHTVLNPRERREFPRRGRAQWKADC